MSEQAHASQSSGGSLCDLRVMEEAGPQRSTCPQCASPNTSPAGFAEYIGWVYGRCWDCGRCFTVEGEQAVFVLAWGDGMPVHISPTTRCYHQHSSCDMLAFNLAEDNWIHDMALARAMEMGLRACLVCAEERPEP